MRRLIKAGLRGEKWVVSLLGIVSLCGYGLVALKLDFYSNKADVLTFFGVHAFLFILYALAFLVLAKQSIHRPLGVVMGFAVAFRLVMLFAGLPPGQNMRGAVADLTGEEVSYEQFLIYDHDVWRYLWDGHVLANGFDPYSRTPAQWLALYDADDPSAQQLFSDERWEDICDYLGYADYTTVYPPLAQAFFRFCHGISPGSVFVLKLGLVLFDLAVCWLLMLALQALKRPRFEVLLYAWNPLVIKEYAGSGHLDPMMISLMVLAIYACLRQKHATTMLSLGLAILAKLTPAFLAPFLLRRTPVRFWPLLLLPLMVGYGYFWQSLGRMQQGLSTFAAEWVFNPGPWLLIKAFVDAVALPSGFANMLAGLFLLAACVWAWFWDRQDGVSLVKICFGILALLLLLSPAVMPWYLPWVLALGVLAGDRSWPLLMLLALGSYLIYIDQQPRTWWLWVTYGVFFAFWGWLKLQHRKMTS